MKRFKNKWLIAALILVAVPAVALVGRANALSFMHNTDKNQTVDSSIYSASKDVDINGTVNGDIFCAGRNINIDATVHGDVICAGQNVTVSGKIDGNVRLAGQDVSVNAAVSRNASVTAMNFSLDANAKVAGDVTAVGQSINLKGTVGRDVLANGSDIIFNGVIARDAEATTEHLTLKGGARIIGNLKYHGANKLEQLSGAKVLGVTEFVKLTPHRRMLIGINVAMFFYALLAVAATNLVLVLLFPRLFAKTSNITKKNFGKSLLVGLVASFVLPVALFFASISFVGIPLALVTLVAYFVACAVGMTTVAQAIGRWSFKDKKGSLVTILTGSVILTVAAFLPWIGFVLVTMAMWTGLGAVLLGVKPLIGSTTHSK